MKLNWQNLPGSIQLCIVLAGLFLSLVLFNSAPLFYAVVWLSIPLVGIACRRKPFLSLFTPRRVTLFRGVLVAFSILLSFWAFSNLEDVGRWFELLFPASRVLPLLGVLGYLALLILIPLVTWITTWEEGKPPFT